MKRRGRARRFTGRFRIASARSSKARRSAYRHEPRIRRDASRKSAEESTVVRIGAAYSERRSRRCGASSSQASPTRLGDITERACARGGTTQIHYSAARRCRIPIAACRGSSRKSRSSGGDCVFLRDQRRLLGLSGQVAADVTVAATPRAFRELYATPSRFYAIAACCARCDTSADHRRLRGDREAGFTTCDDIMHGYGGGYFPPVLGARAGRGCGPISATSRMTGRAAQRDQKDQRAGVQVGELLH